MDRQELNIDLVGFEDHCSTADHKLAHPARSKSSAHHDALCLLPILQLEKTTNDQGEFLREFLDGALNDPGRFPVAAGQELVELLLRQLRRLAATPPLSAGLWQICHSPFEADALLCTEAFVIASMGSSGGIT
jgi:hypothetical protein